MGEDASEAFDPAARSREASDAAGAGARCFEPLRRALPEPLARAPAALVIPGADGRWRLVACTGAPAAAQGSGAVDPPLLPSAQRALDGLAQPRAVALPDGLVAGGTVPAAELLVLPLLDGDRVAAQLLLPAERAAALSASELEAAWLRANLTFAALARAADRERLRRAEAHIEREMREVASLQRLLLPPEDQRIRGAEIAARLDTFGPAGGDYYDFMSLTHYYADRLAPDAPDVFGTMVADVTGHGAAAAVEAAMFDAVLRTFPGGPSEGPAPVLAYANRHFFTRRGRPHFITAFAALFDPVTETLRYTSAGHPPGLRKRQRDGGVEILDGARGIPLGVLPEAGWENASCPFEIGDCLVLYTDGLLESRSPEGEQLGLERLVKTVGEGGATAAELLASVRAAVAAHERGASPSDDRTVVVVRRVAV